MKYIKAIHCYFIRFLSETIFPAVIKCCNVFSITPATEEWPFGPDTLKSIAMESFFLRYLLWVNINGNFVP